MSYPYYDATNGKGPLTCLGQYGDHGWYEYDMVGVFKTEDGRIMVAHTSGCSCTAPFDELNDIEDGIHIQSLDQLRDELGKNERVTVDEKLEALRMVEPLLA